MPFLEFSSFFLPSMRVPFRDNWMNHESWKKISLSFQALILDTRLAINNYCLLSLNRNVKRTDQLIFQRFKWKRLYALCRNYQLLKECKSGLLSPFHYNLLFSPLTKRRRLIYISRKPRGKPLPSASSSDNLAAIARTSARGKVKN